MSEKFNMANNRAIFVDIDKQVIIDTSLSLNSTRVHQEPVQNPCVDTNDEISTMKCKHFSIRGYVSEVRKRDPKLCYPFPVNESIIDLTKELPPMTIPESRWWRCSGCVPEAKNYDGRLPNDSCGNAKEAQKGAKVDNTAVTIASNNDLRLGLSSKVDNTAAVVRISEGFTSTDSDLNKDNKIPVVSNTLSDRKGKGKALVTCDDIPPFSGSSNGYSRGDPQTSSQHRHSESPANGLVARVAGKVSGSCSRSQGVVNLPDLNECSDEPSEELLHHEATIIILSDDEEDYLGTERRKRPKSRLMSELLRLKETEYPGKGKNKIQSSSSSQDESVKRKRVGRPVISVSDYDSDSSDVSNEKISGVSGKKRHKSKKPKMDSFSPHKITKPRSSPEKRKSSAEELPHQRVDHRFAHFSEENVVPKKKRGSGSAQGRNMSKASESTQKDGQPEQKPTEIIGHFLRNSPNKENKQQSLQKKDSLNSQSSQVRKEKESRQNEETRTSAVGVPMTGNHSDPERRIDNPTGNTEADDKSRPPAQDMPIQVSDSVPKQKEQTKSVRGRIPDIDINSIPTDDKPNDELGTGDDNLMEIAELMVKIRHDRQNNDLKENNHVSSVPPRPSPGTNARQSEAQGSSGQPVQIFGSSAVLNLQKPQSTTMVNGNSSHNAGVGGAARENPVSSRFVYPNQDVQQIHQYSASRLLHQNVQVWSSPQQHLTQPSSAWSQPGMSSRMPLGITNPRQMVSPRPNTLNDGSFRHQNSRTLNFENPADQSSSRPPTGVTVNVNEAIPAMHLLSLMQNAATELSLGPQQLAVPSSSSRFPFANNNNSRHPYYPSTLPTASPFTSSSLNNDKGIIIGRNSGRNGFMGPTIPLTLRGQRNMLGSSRLAPRAPTSRNPRPSRQVRKPPAPPLDKGKSSIASTSNPVSVNNPVQVVKESLNSENEKPVSQPEPEQMTCQLNQNPSEFNDLKLVAKYMNGPEDLRPKKRKRQD